ncbi:ABC1 kinase family protein [Mycobacteroides salmoniphilum]|uniref:ABC1 kinase family protein n=1 Tax=Mycobacteroides salmoniphilum TaxID=404941 RepID=UPI000992EB09|nr:AarF/UbiB family protein [Mycobacteroides salmoniphilum]
MTTPEGAGNDAAPLAAGMPENGRQQPIVPESTSEPPTAAVNSPPKSGSIDIEITRPRVRLHPPPFRVEAGRFGVVVARLAGSGARLLTKPRRGRTLEVRAAHELRRAFALMGPTYVKLGQIIASSPGVFPETLSNEFRTLLDRVPPAPPELIRQSLRDQLGADPAAIFATFDDHPFASASIAQVHHATLKSGERVVVKIQRPKIRTRLAADVRIIGRLARLIVKTDLGRASNAPEIVEDFEQNLNEELDFSAEGHAMEQWMASLADTEYGDTVRVPKVFWEYTTERVLTMEYVEGIRIDNVGELAAAGFDGVGLVKAIVYSLFETGFHKGLFHGDLHAGNLLVDSSGRIVFLDFGIVGRIDERSRKIFTEIMVDLFVKNDHAAVSRGIYKLGAIGDRGKAVDPTTAAKAISDFTNPLQSAKLSAISYGQLGKQLAAMAKQYDVRLPRELVLISKQLLYVERYMKLLAPDWALLSDPSFIGYFGNMVIQAEQSRMEEAAARESK